MRFEPKDARDQFQQAFGFPVEELTATQLWWITKFAKHVRMRARNNAAFNNYCNQVFAPSRFKEVNKTGPRGPYKGLEIEAKGVTDSQEEAEE